MKLFIALQATFALYEEFDIHAIPTTYRKKHVIRSARLPQNFYPEELEGDKLGDQKRRRGQLGGLVKNWIPLTKKFGVYQFIAAPPN